MSISFLYALYLAQRHQAVFDDLLNQIDDIDSADDEGGEEEEDPLPKVSLT